MGVEPTYSAWEANVLPINYIRVVLYYTTFLVYFQAFSLRFVKKYNLQFINPSIVLNIVK